MLPVGKETGKSDSVFLFAYVGIKGFYRAGVWCWPMGPGGGRWQEGLIHMYV